MYKLLRIRIDTNSKLLLYLLRVSISRIKTNAFFKDIWQIINLKIKQNGLIPLLTWYYDINLQRLGQ